MIYRKAWLGIHAEPPVTPISSDETPASILLNLKQMHLTVLPVLTLIPQSPAWGQPVDRSWLRIILRRRMEKSMSTPFFKHLGSKQYTSKQPMGQRKNIENKKYIKT